MYIHTVLYCTSMERERERERGIVDVSEYLSYRIDGLGGGREDASGLDEYHNMDDGMKE